MTATHIDFLRAVFREHAEDEAFVWRDVPYTYAWILAQIDENHRLLAAAGIESGAVVTLHGTFSPHALAALLCLIERETIVVPIAPTSEQDAERFTTIAQATFAVHATGDAPIAVSRLAGVPDHPLLRRLRDDRHPGLVLFSSGSTGEPKGVVHDLVRLLQKYRTRRHCYRTLAFLLFDHIGGIDTALYSLSNGSCLVLCEDRSPDAICAAVERHRVEVLPVAPSFLFLLALSGAYRRYDLTSLRIVTYGAEMMSQKTLDRCRAMFPGVTLMQKYGVSELGTLRSKSKASDSLWVKIGGEGYETRVVDGQLQVRAAASMLGYLNAPSPFTEDGWFLTGDCVAVDGEYIRFLGRATDVVNVGGRKVYPAEVESIIAGLDNVQEVAVFGEANPLLGQIVCAVVRPVIEEDVKQLRRRIRAACRERLEDYKVPVKVEVTSEPLTTERFKVRRRPQPSPTSERT